MNSHLNIGFVHLHKDLLTLFNIAYLLLVLLYILLLFSLYYIFVSLNYKKSRQVTPFCNKHHQQDLKIIN